MTEPHVVDCLGQPCPVPVIELARAIAERAGRRARSCCCPTTPPPAADIQAWCRMRGHSFEGADGPAYRVKRLV